MSDGLASGGSIANQPGQGTLGTAKGEASALKDTAASEAGHVVETAKEEAAGVAREAKYAAKDLYAQTRQELQGQAQTQQQRVASGLRSVGDELDSMARGSENQGVASDLVRQVSGRISSAASWLGDRDPGSVLDEVKSYARRKPGIFIAVAALAGLAAGRLTRALASNAKEEADRSSAMQTRSTTPPMPTTVTTSPYPAAGEAAPQYRVAGEETPVFQKSWGATAAGEGTGNVGSDPL